MNKGNLMSTEGFENNISGGGSWLLKYIVPGVIVSIISSSIISYGAVRAITTQQINDGKRIDQIQENLNMNRAEIFKHGDRLSKIETIVTQVSEFLDDNRKELRLIKSTVNGIERIVVVLKDRNERNDSESKSYRDNNEEKVE